MYEFTYRRANSLDDAEAKFRAAADASLMAGGMTLIPTLKQRLAMPTDVIDLGGIAELAGVRVDCDMLVVGAMTAHDVVATSAEVQAFCPALAELAGLIGDPMVRNRGTIGGSIANNDPAADYPAALVGLGATVVTAKRELAADDLFTAMFETALAPGEIVREVRFPRATRAAYAKFPNPASRYAIVGVFVAEAADGIRVAVTGAAASVFRHGGMEAALAGSFTADAVAGMGGDVGLMNADIHASAEYRAHLVGVMACRAVASIA